MKVLHVDPSTEWRGGQQQLVYLLAGRPGDLWAGVPQSPLAARLGPPALALRPHNDPRNAWALRTRLPEVDLVAAHTPHAHGAALLARRPVVVHRRVDFAPRDPWKYRRIAHVVAVSEGVRRVLIHAGVSASCISVVHDGVPFAEEVLPDPRPFAGLPRPWYLAVGALVPHKGHRHLLAALRQVEGGLLLLGEGPLRSGLEAQVAELGLADRVRFGGHLAPLGPVFAACDAFVHPSVEEGLGQVVLEALGAGCRVLATRAGGVPEVVGVAGLLVPPGDESALTEGLRRVLAVPRRLGIAPARHFSVDRMVQATGEVYDAVLRGSRGGRR